jgi:hypothetical protein
MLRYHTKNLSVCSYLTVVVRDKNKSLTLDETGRFDETYYCPIHNNSKSKTFKGWENKSVLKFNALIMELSHSAPLDGRIVSLVVEDTIYSLW